MTNVQDLGVIKRVDLREVWSSEPTDFTPWLADQIAELGESLGMDLEVENQEAAVGSFSLDLLARDVGSNRPVIIENQLELTNHDHLGKLLTYAAGYDAGVIVWIAKEFREEHRQAMDWLNQHSDDNTEFFGVQIEAWKIDNSRVAPHFSLIVTPNEWQRETKRKISGREPSDRAKQYHAFFSKLIDALRKIGFTKAKKAQPRHYVSFSSGHGSEFNYVVSFATGKNVRVELYIDAGPGKKDWNKNKFSEIHQRKNAIEAEIGESLNWERLEGRRASRIAMYRDGSIEDQELKLEELRKWMVETLVAFKSTFSKSLDDYELDDYREPELT